MHNSDKSFSLPPMNDHESSLPEAAMDELDRHCGAPIHLELDDELSIPATFDTHCTRSSTNELRSQPISIELR